MPTLILLFLLLVSVPGWAATRLVVASGGATTGDCTSTACTVDRAITQAVPGDTITLANGTYSGSTTINCNSGAQDGTSLNRITLKATNERQAFLSGSGAAPLQIYNCDFWTIEGLHLANVDNGASIAGSPGSVMFLQSSNNLILRRLLVHHPNRYGNTHAIEFYIADNNLVEENEVYDFHRHGIIVQTGTGNIYRRNYVNSRGFVDLPGCNNSLDGVHGWCSNQPAGDSGLMAYPAAFTIMENNISEGNGFGFDMNARFGNSEGNKYYGNIANDNYYGFSLTAGSDNLNVSDMPLNSIWENNVSISGSTTNRGFRGRSTKNLMAHNNTVIGAGAEAGWMLDLDPTGLGDSLPTSFATNLLVTKAASSSAYGISVTDQSDWSLNYVNVFNFTNNTPALNDSHITNSSTTDPQLGACYAWVPDASPMKGAGLGGADIGANVLYRYQDGALSYTPLWDVSTGAFPCGAVVTGVNDNDANNCRGIPARFHINQGGCSFPASYGAAPGVLDFDEATLAIPSRTYGVANEACVSPSGGDITVSTGSELNSAAENAGNIGKNIFLNAGTYSIGSTLEPVQGVTIRPNNCAAATITTRVVPCDDNLIAGLTISFTIASGTSADGTITFNRGDCTGSIIRNNLITAAGLSVVSFRGGPVTATVEGNDLVQLPNPTSPRPQLRYNTVVDATVRGNRFRISGVGIGVADNISPSSANNWSGHLRILSNYFVDNDNEDFIDLKSSNVAGSIIDIEDNYFNGPGITGTAGPGCILVQSASAHDGTYTANVRGNYFDRCPKSLVYLTSTSETGAFADVTLNAQHNIIVSTSAADTAMEINRNNASVRANTIIGGTFEVGNTINPDPSGVSLTDNIFSGVTFDGSSNIDFCAYNTFYNALGLGATCSNSLTSDPLFVNIASNWHLLSTSPSRISNSIGLDRGAYEYEAGLPFGIVAKYLFDEGTGTTVADSTGYGHTGTFAPDAGWTTGRIGPYAGLFDGTRYVSISGVSELRPTTQASIGVWFKATTTDVGGSALVALPNDGLMPYLTSLGRAACQLYDELGNFIAITSSGSYLDDAWNFLDCSYLKGDGLYLRVNHTQVGFASLSTNISYNIGGTNNVELGRSSGNTTSLNFVGSLDHITIKDTACDAACDLALFQEGLTQRRIMVLGVR